MIPQGQTVPFLQYVDSLQMIISFWVATEEVNIATLKTVLKKREPGKSGPKKIGCRIALKDSTGKVIGNWLVSTFTIIILLTRIFGDIRQQGIWVLMTLKSLWMLKKQAQLQEQPMCYFGRPILKYCNSTGY